MNFTVHISMKIKGNFQASGQEEFSFQVNLLNLILQLTMIMVLFTSRLLAYMMLLVVQMMVSILIQLNFQLLKSAHSVIQLSHICHLMEQNTQWFSWKESFHIDATLSQMGAKRFRE